MELLQPARRLEGIKRCKGCNDYFRPPYGASPRSVFCSTHCKVMFSGKRSYEDAQQAFLDTYCVQKENRGVTNEKTTA